jgi:Arc/MetJ-type ribon-helix-helix transcriptional regulator
MPRLTVTIEDEQSELLEELSGEGGEYDSKSEAVRDFIQRGETVRELRDEIARLEERVDQREQRIDELQSQLTERSRVEKKIDELPDKVREARLSYDEKRKMAIDRASTWEALKWRLSGKVPRERIDEIGDE